MFAISACSHDSTAKPNATPQATGIDALIVSVEDVRRIADYDELTTHGHEAMRNPPPGDLNAPGPCRAAGTSDLTFAPGWNEFRSAGYSGVTDDIDPGGRALVDSVSQAVAIYPNERAARSALDQLLSSLQACVALHDPNYDFTVDKSDATTVRITDQGWSHFYRAKNAVLISVGVVGIEPTERVASVVLQVVTDRVK
ncbi:sensor domain-containing protein [Mycobacterium bourgelatii]